VKSLEPHPPPSRQNNQPPKLVVLNQIVTHLKIKEREMKQKVIPKIVGIRTAFKVTSPAQSGTKTPSRLVVISARAASSDPLSKQPSAATLTQLKLGLLRWILLPTHIQETLSLQLHRSIFGLLKPRLTAQIGEIRSIRKE
jgi:hypothetical protein